MFREFIDNNKENILNTVCDLIKFQSISKETNQQNTPFGIECKKALEYTLKLGEKLGFRTKNIDGYCGYIEFGEGKELVGIIGHLDVVPALEDDGWTTPPFEPYIRDNKLFGRGAIDDKGPVIASLYAMKAVAEKCNINKRVRLILGLDEECGWRCIERYKQTEESPTIGFSPDANFPAIYAEKGILSLCLINPFSLKDFEILDIDCKNNAINVVPKYASITLKSLNKDNIVNFTEEENIEIKKLDTDIIQIISKGVSSHAAHPSLGKNAITILFNYLLKHIKNEYLQTLYHLGVFEIESPEFLARKDISYPTEFEDNSIIQDESGVLTSNIASAKYFGNNLELNINLRVPVNTSLDIIFLQYMKLKNFFDNIVVKELSRQEPLLVDKNSFLVTKLVNIFNEAYYTKKVPEAIGGGTYARAFKNCISYGPKMPEESDMCHQVDEYINIDTLINSAKIYAKAIYELAK